MREIKFRAWDYHAILDKHIMRSHEEISSNCLKYVTDNVSFPNRQIMQFTGLKDGGGNEIYEFDFVKFRPNYTSKPTGEQIGLIVFYENQWMLQVNEYYYSISEETDEFYCYSEVVGNPFENPDILTQHKN
jgi:uncharacterized phage protein (TIGR01671 family)